MALDLDLDLTSDDIRGLTSVDAVAAFLTKLGYPTGCRREELPSAYGLNPETQDAVRRMELLASDDEGFFRVLFAQLKSLTAKTRTELVRNLGRLTTDHLLVLTKDFLTTEFVLIDKKTRERGGAAKGPGVHPIPRIVTVERKEVGTRELRVLRRLTWTCKDGLDQFHKLRSVFESAHYSSRYFENRALFADHFLEARLPEDPAWSDSPNDAFHATKALMDGARSRWAGEDEQTARVNLFAPAWKLLGFKPKIHKTAKQDHPTPDYLLHGEDGKPIAAAFVYRWDRWLDGADPNDTDTPDENPGAVVVSTLAKGDARWVIVTNGKRWRLYSRDAHSRATNFYEVDLEEALADADDTDPNRAFRYWWLFFRREAFEPLAGGEQEKCWLDEMVQGSRDYAKRLGDRLKTRVFEKVFPLLAEGFLTDRRRRLGLKKTTTDQELTDMFEATLTLLYRLLFLLYAEARDLLPIGEAPYGEASLKRIKDEIADKAGNVESEVSDKLKVYAEKTTDLYDRMGRLFAVMDLGDPSVNVPCYNGGLFVTEPARDANKREHHIARFLLDHKVPDRFLALAIDRLARDPDEKTFALVSIDYKSLQVRHLGSIYEGLLEFKLEIAEEDLTTKTEKKREKYIPLSQVKPGKRRKKNAPVAVVRKGAVYLSNDKAERKATGSYYTPDPIVQYIVEHTVGPVLDEKLEALRPELSKASKTFRRHMTNAKRNPGLVPTGADPRELAASQAYAEHRDLVDRVFDMKILDPAMGSGHFLVEAVDFVTDRLLDFLNRFPHNPVRFMLEQTRKSILSALTEQGVTVDADKLTDVNLLKRHVLKRCIYGVDLNPMAVELAKVSLWLDAFTLGAPLSFLDHHLRCGNSLIGESDISEHILGTERQRELRQTVKNMMEISRTADANLADVTASKKLFEEAQRLAQPFKNRLHIETAKHFLGFKDDVHANMARFPHDKGLNPDRIPKVLKGSYATYLEVLRTAAENRFFHWELEFPEVFFGFADANQRHLKHRNGIEPGSAGFDAVVGNPPYVRMEMLKPIKPFLKAHYKCHAERADLFIYFYERASRSVRSQGRYSFITSSTWTKTSAGGPLRSLIVASATIESHADLTRASVFEDAMTYPCVLVLAHHPAHQGHSVLTHRVTSLDTPVEHWPTACFPQSKLSGKPWRFENASVIALREKLESQGSPLRALYGPPLYGIKTGLNEAFVVDNETKNALVAQDPGCERILRPFIEGKDLKPWRVQSRDLWLIYCTKGTVIDDYPAIREHLSQYRDRLSARAAQQEWHELQQAQSRYAAAFQERKIVYSRFVNKPTFALDEHGFFVNNAVSVIPTDDPVLLLVLMSPVTWFYLSCFGAPMANGYRQIHGHVLEAVPIPQLSEASRNAIVDWWNSLRNGDEGLANPPWNILYEAYGLSARETETLTEGIDTC